MIDTKNPTLNVMVIAIILLLAYWITNFESMVCLGFGYVIGALQKIENKISGSGN